jgi:hypothetical protein
VCGCGKEVVTPLSPTDWSVTFNGKTVSFDPSIGNWNFKCQSHYWIKENKVIICRKWHYHEIEDGRKNDKKFKKAFFKKRKKWQWLNSIVSKFHDKINQVCNSDSLGG